MPTIKEKADELKKLYNYYLTRMRKAEKYFATHTVKECEMWLSGFNEITEMLSILINEYKNITGHEMTIEEIQNGFK